MTKTAENFPTKAKIDAPGTTFEKTRIGGPTSSATMTPTRTEFYPTKAV